MESLALVVAVLVLTAFLAGPISIGLSSSFVRSRLTEQPSLTLVIINILRKVIHLLLVAIGTLVGVQFLIISGLPFFPRLIGLFGVVTCYIGLRREYFPEFFFVRELAAKFGIRGKNSGSSGNDGHGPEGQH